MSGTCRTGIALCLLAALVAACLVAASPAEARRRSHRVHTEKSPPVTIGTPIDKAECIAMSQALYGRAKKLSRGKKNGIPKEFTQVVTNLNESCGEEEFARARVSIDWMDTCLKNFSKDEFCSRDKIYFCAIDPRSAGCLSQ
jgi:hypothetical protein